MSTTYGNFSITLPTSGMVQWDGVLNDLLQAIADCLNSQVPPSGINVSSALDAKGNPVIDLTGLGFIPVSAPPVTGPCAYINGNELHYVDTAGNDIALTASGSLNTSINGGIGGQYISAAAHLNYVASNNSYTHTDANGNVSLVDCGGLIARNGIGYFELIASPNIGGTQYTLNMPATGLSYLASTLTGSQVGIIGVDATGSMNFNPSPTVRNITVSGSVARTVRTKTMSCEIGRWQGSGIASSVSLPGTTISNGTTGWMALGITLEDNERVTGVTVFGVGDTGTRWDIVAAVTGNFVAIPGGFGITTGLTTHVQFSPTMPFSGSMWPSYGGGGSDPLYLRVVANGITNADVTRLDITTDVKLTGH